MSRLDRPRAAIDRNPVMADGVIAAILLVLALLTLWAMGTAGLPGVTVVSVAMTALTILPLTWRRRYPLATLVATAGGLAAHPFLGLELVDWSVTGFWLALYSAGAYGERRRDLIRAATVAVVVGLIVRDLFFVDLTDFPGSIVVLRTLTVVANAVVIATVWWFGDSVRTRRLRELELAERTAQLEHEREENARRAVFHERVRIARELHDVVAHHVSVMGIQAGAARRVLTRQPDQPAKVEEVLADIEATSREAVQELHRLLGFLRREDEPDGLSPQPSLGQLGDLVARMREAGLPVEMSIEGERRPLSAGVELSAYRIVQEALTNVLRHAGKARASVTVRYGADAVDIEILDDGRGTDDDESPGQGGNGLIGMRERVGLLGGTLSVGRHTGVGFSVRARLPISQAAT